MQCQLDPEKNWAPSHKTASEWESAIIGDFNGYWQAPPEKTRTITGQEVTLHVKFSTVQYDILVKTGATGRPTQMSTVKKIPK